MYDPVSTYRVQLHSAFDLKKLRHIIPYLAKMGAGTLYASPIFRSVKGSMHGYDVLDPNTVNPEIGTVEELYACRDRLQAADMGWLQDIVPNHMAFSPSNPWLMDVLEKGSGSKFYDFFDFYAGKHLVVPFLDKDADSAAADGDLKLALSHGKPVLRYFDSDYPVRTECYSSIMNRLPLPEGLATSSSHNSAEPDVTNRAASPRRFQELWNDPAGSAFLKKCVSSINDDTDALISLINRQHYRLINWREANSSISYRRFFTINGLISLNIQDQRAFDIHHRLTRQLVKDGVFNGLRVDHIDGLYDPAGYLNRLREMAGEDCYLVVEKILEPDELLARDWPVQGTTGYDFLGMVNQLLTNHKTRKKFDVFYKALVQDATSPEVQLQRKKEFILYRQMSADLDQLMALFAQSDLVPVELLNAPGQPFRETIATLLTYCPVYRYYPSCLPLREQEAAALQALLRAIKQDKPWLLSCVQALKRLWLSADLSPVEADRALHLYRRCMQYSGPLMAKGKEDTLLYTYARFMGHNDVGDGVTRFGASKEDFHRGMLQRVQHQPHALNATSTHDTKMGEDVRARLAVLTDLADEWLSTASKWLKPHQKRNAPDANERFLLLQMVLGAHPMPGEPTDDFKERLRKYIPKVLREAKVHSDWNAPDEIYEKETIGFALGLLAPESPLYGKPDFLEKVIDFGIMNSLIQLVLKCTCPGIPDIYQGTELWDLSLVDPDNRRPVDYDRRTQLLERLNKELQPGEQIRELWASRYDGGIKLWLTKSLLHLRRQHATLFFKGDYVPLEVRGKFKNHILAYARFYDRKWVVVITALHFAELCRMRKCRSEDVDWSDTYVILPKEAPRVYEHVWTGETGTFQDELPVKTVFEILPIALLKLEAPPNERRAGVLLAISSLPSGYGIGDLGPGAYAFARFLKRTQQRVWQLLPLNPVERANGFSPYSSVSSMACNSLLISPDELIQQGLLLPGEVRSFVAPYDRHVDYEWAETSKALLLDIAYERFEKHPAAFTALHHSFKEFCCEQHYWLQDFAMFTTLREHYKTSWNLWPEEYRCRDKPALRSWRSEYKRDISKIKWQQFIFHLQWRKLSNFCRMCGIGLLGDLPFYVNYDSADVWANPELFMLDKELGIKGVAGVPSDYFSRDGQLWGMPTFDWKQLKHTKYKWWILRLKRNLELFDTLRLDHFRAFEAYWEVPVGAKTARGGSWKKGPGIDFFNVVKEVLEHLPFVAEDLGDNMDEVYMLRDAVGLRGMKVLQFGFGEQGAQSVDAPHNYRRTCIAYSGTHDNNTVVGWYAEETTAADRMRLDQYFGLKVTRANVSTVLCRAAYASVADTAIIQMQDLLGLDASARMNQPGMAYGNWNWSLLPSQMHPALEKQLLRWVQLFNRF